jgi:hypothetical protein
VVGGSLLSIQSGKSGEAIDIKELAELKEYMASIINNNCTAAIWSIFLGTFFETKLKLVIQVVNNSNPNRIRYSFYLYGRGPMCSILVNICRSTSGALVALLSLLVYDMMSMDAFYNGRN